MKIPKLQVNPLPIRPPKKWWDLLYPKVTDKYHRFPNETEQAYDKRITGIISLIWMHYPLKTKQYMCKMYDGTCTSTVRMLPCPKCGILNPVKKVNLFLRCTGCKGRLISVHVRKK